MSLETLLLVTVVLLGAMGAGLIYFILFRIRKRSESSDERFERLTEELLEKIETQSLTDEQRAKIADAIREAKRRT